MILPIRYEVRRLYAWPLFLLALQFWLNLAGGLGLTYLAYTKTQYSHLWFVSAFMYAFALYVSYVRRSLMDAKSSGRKQAIALAALSIPNILFPFGLAAFLDLINDKRTQKFNGLIQKREEALAGYAGEISPSDPAISSHALVAGSMIVVAMLFVANYFYQSGNVSALEFGRPEYKVDMNKSVPELYEVGRACNSDGDSKCAVAVFDRILQLDPGDMTAMANLAMAQTQLGEHASASQTYEIYFQRGGGGVDTMAYFARTLNALNDKPRALEWNMRALRAAPNLIDVAQQVTSLLIEMHEEEKAIQFIDGFVNKNPTANSYFENIRGQLAKQKPAQAKEAI